MVTGDDPRTAALAALGLPAGATRAQVAAAYRRAVLATHPDRCAEADAAERFAAVVAAHRQALQEPPAADPAGPATRAEAQQPSAAPPSRTVPLVAGPVCYTPYRRYRQRPAPNRRG